MRLPIALFIAFIALGAAPATKPSSRPGGEIVPPARRDVPGKRVALEVGELYVPDFCKAKDKADVVLWFLGAAWCAEQVFYDAHKNAAILVVDAKVWKDGVDAKEFDAMIDAVSKSLDRPVGKICVASFSGGYSATHDILKDEKLRGRVSDVVLCDSLYPPKSKEGVIDAEWMKPIVAFANDAIDGKKTFVFSQLYPLEEQYRGNTTSLAAKYLTDAVGVKREEADGKSSRGAKILYRASKGNFCVLGYAGMTNQDHFEHFYGAADLFKLTSLENADAR